MSVDTGAREPHTDAELNEPRDLSTERLAEIVRQCLLAWQSKPAIPGSFRWSRNGITALHELERRLLAAGVGVPPDEAECPPLDTKAVLWVAAIDRVPIEDRIEWVERMLARVEQINAMRAGVGEARPAEPPGYGWGGGIDEENARLAQKGKRAE